MAKSHIKINQIVFIYTQSFHYKSVTALMLLEVFHI